ncbi:hypothetical protein F0L74_27115 [Chitinophaga agrisoli]|uniref:Uncharacterized protein n=1 Tax=Chitinophaga agrisoli TaxID=2607653 RepID=A0A5B2VMI0_9BACT|nr:hypothetical protein [Chitinophaga agrisoli]KAA2239860.1 hypothetical protein F0L74_27115 [Chitinophaga agrisoli]
MQAQANKTQENGSRSVADKAAQLKSTDAPFQDAPFQFEDHRPEAVAQRKLQEMANQYAAQRQPIQKKDDHTGLSVSKTGLPASLHAVNGGTRAAQASVPVIQQQSAKPGRPIANVPSDAPVQRVAFNQYIAHLVPKSYYYIKIDKKDVIAQYLGTDDTQHGLGYWFNDFGRGDRAKWLWEQPIGQSRFYLLASDVDDISPLESPQQYLANQGFAALAVDWTAQLASASGAYETWAYTKVNDASIQWHPVKGWMPIMKHNRNVNIFPPLETDLIVEDSVAYVHKDGTSICFLFSPDQTSGFQFIGKPQEVIALLALHYAHINKAAVPRSGKARAAADTDQGSQRLPSADEAAYGSTTKAAATSVGKTDIDANSSIDIKSSSTGSEVTVIHKGPWKKGDRGSGQADAMGGQNAKNYVVDRLANPQNKTKDALRTALSGRYEWLHVVGSSLGGINVKENLVAGSYDANTKMIALEHRVARWGTRDYSGDHAPTAFKPITIKGKAVTHADNRVGKSISLEVSHGGTKVASGDYNVEDQTVITKSEYAAEEKRVDDEIKANS